jgi:hypothetical protein
MQREEIGREGRKDARGGDRRRRRKYAKGEDRTRRKEGCQGRRQQEKEGRMKREEIG